MSRVYVAYSLPEDILRPLISKVEVEVWPGEEPVPRDELLASVAGCDGLLSMITTRVDEELLAAAPNLRVVSQMAVGVDNIDMAACESRGVLVGHTPDVLTETVADTAFALLATSVRRLAEGARVVTMGEWGPWNPWFLLGGDLHGITLGIVGMGRIGQAIHRRAAGFQMRVLYSNPTRRQVPGASQVDLATLLAESDALVLSAPLNDDTRGMIGAAQLKAMKPTAHLVNVARGPLVQTADLVEALTKGWIAGAALDVTDPEPLPADHPLLELDNCLVVPHIGSASVATRRAMAELAVANLIAGLDGDPMPARFPSS